VNMCVEFLLSIYAMQHDKVINDISLAWETQSSLIKHQATQ